MTIFIVGGGTGGHLYPGLVVAAALRARGDDPVFLLPRRANGGLGEGIVARAGYEAIAIPGEGFPRRLSLKWITAPANLAAGAWLAALAMRRWTPRAVLALGGYLAAPAVFAAKQIKGMRIVLLEPNVVPGLANRMLAPWADAVAVGFEETASRFGARVRVIVTGTPVRPDIRPGPSGPARRELGLDDGKRTVLVLGGSLGSRRLNEVVPAGAAMMSPADRATLQVLHLTGSAREEERDRVRQAYARAGVVARVEGYREEMGAAYAAADLVIARAGAVTCAEILAVGRPAILVPFPGATESHQEANGRALETRSAARIILDEEFTSDRCATLLAGIPALAAGQSPPIPAPDAAKAILALLAAGTLKPKA